MELFCFASRDIENIQIGIVHQLWAVSTLSNQQSMLQRTTKARRNLWPGKYGLLYCNPLHAFTTPFIVESKVDLDRTVVDVWPQAWCLPFRIRTLGDTTRYISKEDAEVRWPFLRRRIERNSGRGGVSAAMNITGTTVFVPIEITHEDWDFICRDLATKSET